MELLKLQKKYNQFVKTSDANSLLKKEIETLDKEISFLEEDMKDYEKILNEREEQSNKLEKLLSTKDILQDLEIKLENIRIQKNLSEFQLISSFSKNNQIQN
eukprot:gnl/Spiro4/2600_TR1250_c0_g1_i1.p1 gnl/Spiro4/2600_TR1250_c0_g1~~gnl/Spiro4/2600_TR1250_c0_g1_i1.p1  ORF type:complete len:102 (-),score=8.33 gnl/Spiro4/2600_TR1250_c0_g1_i1:78-383(-)